MGRCITGWLNYFRYSRTYQALVDLDHWLRRRVRMGFLKAGNCSAYEGNMCRFRVYPAPRSYWPPKAVKFTAFTEATENNGCWLPRRSNPGVDTSTDQWIYGLPGKKWKSLGRLRGGYPIGHPSVPRKAGKSSILPHNQWNILVTSCQWRN